MLNRTITHSIGNFGRWLAISALLSFGLVMAQTAPAEPTLKQIYDAAQAGQLDKAQTMVQQVLVLHPNSARAHFVQAELFARQGQLPKARDALAAADKLAPGLPFAKSEAIQSLRAQLDAKGSPPALKNQPGGSLGAVSPTKSPAAPANLPWGLILLGGGAAIALVVFLIRRKPAQTFTPPAPYTNFGNSPGTMPGTMPGGGQNGPGGPNGLNGLNGPQTFGMGAGNAPGTPAYGQPQGQVPGQPYAQPPAGSGMGGRLAGGLATGLAVGAGMMAAQAIGKTLTGNNENANRPADGAGHDNSSQQPLSNNASNGPANNDMGGQNFGVEDNGSWDDAGAGGDGGGDWDT